jgi:EAL and modified HD-GYP domain-containing signal transduction protein
VLMARQPIFDRDSQVVAYELLFRQDMEEAANVQDGDFSTSQVLLNAFTHFGIEEAVGKHTAFVNFTRHLLENPPPFDKSRLVIEILESEHVDEELVCTVSKLVDEGYTIALDDFVLEPGWERLLELASVVKVDVMDTGAHDLEGLTAHLQNYSCRLLAEKVEDSAMYERCRALGFELFQGYFLCRPQLMRGRGVPASKLLVMELLNVLQQPDTTNEQLEELVVRDPVLVHKVLSLVNSAAFVVPTRIESISWAIAWLGLDNIRNLASLLMLSRLPEKPLALRSQAIQRAKMCELIGRKVAPGQESTLFSVGLLSLLDAFFDVELEQVLAKLALSEEMQLAILEHKGLPGRVLALTLAHEQGCWEELDWQQLEKLGVTPALVNSCYRESIEWADKVTSRF